MHELWSPPMDKKIQEMGLTFCLSMGAFGRTGQAYPDGEEHGCNARTLMSAGLRSGFLLTWALTYEYCPSHRTM